MNMGMCCDVVVKIKPRVPCVLLAPQRWFELRETLIHHPCARLQGSICGAYIANCIAAADGCTDWLETRSNPASSLLQSQFIEHYTGDA